MKRRITVGFPRMREEPGEIRAFLPEFVQALSDYADVLIEKGYGKGMGYRFSDYKQGNDQVTKVSQDEAYACDYVIVLRAPDEDLWRMNPGTCLISMLHYGTRGTRVKILHQLGLGAISLDSIVDDSGQRLVENIRAVAWNGVRVAFQETERYKKAYTLVGPPFHVLVLGTGTVGRHAVDAAAKLGDYVRNARQIKHRWAGSIVTSVGRNITHNQLVMRDLLKRTDILIDATQRRDPTVPVVPNYLLAYLPAEAIILDLVVDPYAPPVVRGIEGIPQGNLYKYVFEITDPEWLDTVPEGVSTLNRRKTVSCYSWPGLYPRECMERYGRQMVPLMARLLAKGYNGISPEGDPYERALYRARLPENI